MPTARCTRVRISLLGPFSLTVGTRSVAATGAQRRAVDLIELLALAPRHRLPREQVVGTLWSHLAPDARFPNLHRAASHARR